MKIRCVLALGVLAGRSWAAVDLPQHVATPDGFTVQLPADWKEIPPDVLKNYAAALAAAMPNAPQQTYEYGFQLTAASKWFTYPYVLIQVRRTGRVPEAQLKAVRKTEAAMNKGAQKFSGNVVSGVSLNETVYDATSHILWTRVAADVASQGRVLGLMGVRLTEFGMVQMMGYAKEDDYPQYATLFESIIKQTELAKNVRYQPRVTDSIPLVNGINWTEVLISGVVGGLAAGIAGLITRKRKQKAQQPPAVQSD